MTAHFVIMKFAPVFGGYFSVRQDAVSTICLFDDIVSIMAEYHDVVTRIPASYLIGPGFISHLGSWLFGLRFFIVFLSTSGFQAYL